MVNYKPGTVLRHREGSLSELPKMEQVSSGLEVRIRTKLARDPAGRSSVVYQCEILAVPNDPENYYWPSVGQKVHLYQTELDKFFEKV